MAIEFACYNIQYGIGADGIFDLERTAAPLLHADIIALQEVTRGFPQNENRDLVESLEALLPDRHSVTGFGTDIDAGSAFENGRTVARRFQFGNMILSRWPIVSVRNFLLPRLRKTGRLNLQRSALEAVIGTPTGPLRLICVHLDHADRAERIAQIGTLREIIGGYFEHGGAATGLTGFGYNELPIAHATLTMGDFNCWPDSPEYAHMASLSGFVDVSAADSGISFRGSNDPDQRLDYVFADSESAQRITHFRIDHGAVGSDHFPLLFSLE